MPYTFFVRIGDIRVNLNQVVNITDKCYRQDSFETERNLIPGAHMLKLSNGESIFIPAEDWTSQVESAFNTFTVR